MAEKSEKDNVIDIQDLWLNYTRPAVCSPPATPPLQLSLSGSEDEMNDPVRGQIQDNVQGVKPREFCL